MTEVTYQFVPIATRPRGDAKSLEWSNLEGAPMTAQQAHEALAAGKIVMVSKHYDDRIELWIKPATPSQAKPERPIIPRGLVGLRNVR